MNWNENIALFLRPKLLCHLEIKENRVALFRGKFS